MTTVQDMPTVEVEKSADERKAALVDAVADLTAHGHTVESRRDYQRVLVGHNQFRAVLVRRHWGWPRHELVEVDKQGKVSVRQV